MPDLIDHDYEAEVALYNQQILIFFSSNEIRISDLSGAFTESILPYNYTYENFLIDNKNIITDDMDHNDKIKMVFHRDYYKKKRNFI